MKQCKIVKSASVMNYVLAMIVRNLTKRTALAMIVRELAKQASSFRVVKQMILVVVVPVVFV